MGGCVSSETEGVTDPSKNKCSVRVVTHQEIYRYCWRLISLEKPSHQQKCESQKRYFSLLNLGNSELGKLRATFEKLKQRICHPTSDSHLCRWEGFSRRLVACSIGDLNLPVSHQRLFFHPYTKGSHITLNSCLHQAERQQSFHNGIIFSNRPLRSKEKLRIRVLKEETRWYGALRIGFTSEDPSSLEPCCLPPFACPDLTQLSSFWGAGIPEELCQEGALLKFWFSRDGKVFCQREGEPCARVLFSGIPKNTKLWAMLDVYGKTKAIQVVAGPSRKNQTYICQCQSQINKDPQPLGNGHNLEEITEQTVIPPVNLNSCTDTNDWDLQKNFQIFLGDDPSCVICQDRMADTLLLPCGHCTFCQGCIEQLHGHSQSCPLCRQTILSAQYIGCGNSITNPVT